MVWEGRGARPARRVKLIGERTQYLGVQLVDEGGGVGSHARLQALHAGLAGQVLPAALGGDEVCERVQQHGGATPAEVVQPQALLLAWHWAGLGGGEGEGHEPQHHGAEVLRGGFVAGA